MYIISFDIVGTILCLVLLLIHIFLYDKSKKSNKLFRAYVICAIFECILDLITAKTIMDGAKIADVANIVLNTIYAMSTVVTAYVGLKMAATRMNYEKRGLRIFANLIMVIGLGTMVVNIFTGTLFTFANGEYVKGKMFILIYVISSIFLGLVPFVIFKNRNTLNNEEKLAPALMVFVLFVALIIQYIFPNLLLNSFGKAVSAFVYLMFLDTPQHIMVRNAVEELESAQQKECQAIDELYAANKEKTIFLTNMTHELRTPINAILGFSEIILRDYECGELKPKVKKINTAGENLIDLVDEIVDFSLSETGELELKPMEYELASAYIMFKGILDKHESAYNQTIERTVTKDLPKRLYGDVKKVANICKKLCDTFNEVLETSDITLDVDKDHIEHNKLFVKITIRDNEVTLTEDELNDNMNVIIAKRLLECMGSELVYSTLDEGGSEFSFIFEQEIVDLKPIGDMKEAELDFINNGDKVEENKSFIMPKAKILVVDDTFINFKIVEGLLSHLKTKVVCASSGKEALELMKDQEFDLVFMDILMPEMDGVTTLKKLREEASIISKDVVVVALTANVFSNAKEYYMSEGFADYLTKPVNGKTLTDTLRKYLPDKMEDNIQEYDVTLNA